MAAKNTGTENINQLYNHYRAVFPHQIQCPGHVDHPSHARCIPTAVNPQNARSMCSILCHLCLAKDQELHTCGLRFLNGVSLCSSVFLFLFAKVEVQPYIVQFSLVASDVLSCQSADPVEIVPDVAPSEQQHFDPAVHPDKGKQQLATFQHRIILRQRFGGRTDELNSFMPLH